MSGTRIWIERLAQCEGEGGTFMLALESGGETVSLAMTPHMARKLSERMRLEENTVAMRPSAGCGFREAGTR